MQKETTIIYMVAGLSSRFGGKIKQFALVGPKGETLIEYSLNQALKAGFNSIVFIVGELTEKPFKDKFGDSYKNIPITYTLQEFNKSERDKPWGTFAALASIKTLNTPFVICNGDDIYGESTFKILHNHLQYNASAATVAYKLIDVLPDTGKTNRGLFTIINGKVTALTEVFNIEKNNLAATHSNPEDPISMNIFALLPEHLEQAKEVVTNFKQTHKGNRTIECLMPQQLDTLIKQKKLIMDCYSTSEKWFGITNPADEEVVRQKLSQYS